MSDQPSKEEHERFERRLHQEFSAGVMAERKRNEMKAEWCTMDSAPTDGSTFVAVNISREIDTATVYRWVGPPNYWHSKSYGICIRPDYQDLFRWVHLPSHSEGGEV